MIKILNNKLNLPCENQIYLLILQPELNFKVNNIVFVTIQSRK